MSSILKWNYSQPDYLEITKPIDVKGEEELLEVIAEKLKNAIEQEESLPYVTANQVGYAYQVYAIRMSDGIEVYANPLMAKDGQICWSREVEYGLDNNYYLPRWSKINVVAYLVDKKLVCERQYENEAAGILQHIMNNLNGISIKDSGLEITPEFDAAPKEEQEEVLKAYLEELNKLLGILEEDIKNDSEVSEQYEAIKFVKARAANEIEAERPVKQNRKMRRWLDKVFKRKKKA